MTLAELIERIRADLAEVDDIAEEENVEDSDWCEVRRDDIEALLKVAGWLVDAETITVEMADAIVSEAFEEADDDPACRVCGCTENSPCPGGCHWVPDPHMQGELCSACPPERTDAIVDEEFEGQEP